MTKLWIKFKQLILIIIFLSSCAVRTDGIMNLRNRPVEMVYFKTNNPDLYLTGLFKISGNTKRVIIPMSIGGMILRKVNGLVNC